MKKYTKLGLFEKCISEYVLWSYMFPPNPSRSNTQNQLNHRAVYASCYLLHAPLLFFMLNITDCPIKITVN